MPLDPGAEQRIFDTNAEFSQDTEYTVTAKPGNEWYGVVFGPGGDAVGDTAGAPVSFSLTPTDKAGTILLGVTAGASSTGTEEGQDSVITLAISHQRTD